MVIELVERLSDAEFSAIAVPERQTSALAAEWSQVYGHAWRTRTRMKHGHHATHEYEQQHAAMFRLIPLVTGVGHPPELPRKSGLALALNCQGQGILPDLSDFASLEFSISPPGLEWTLVHTHEDHGLGGPYFIYREWADQSRP